MSKKTKTSKKEEVTWLVPTSQTCNATVDDAVSVMKMLTKDKKPDTFRHAVVTMGYSGAGKSTALSKIPKKNYVVIDPDTIMSNLSDYDAATFYRDTNGKKTKIGDAQGWAKCIGASVELCNAIVESAVHEGLNLIIDFPGAWKRIPMLQSAGYYVTLLYVNTSAKQALKNHDSRAKSTGRFVFEPSQDRKQLAKNLVSDKLKNPHLFFPYIAKWVQEIYVYDYDKNKLFKHMNDPENPISTSELQKYIKEIYDE